MSYLDDNRPVTFREWLRKTGAPRPKLVWWRPSLLELLGQVRWGWLFVLPVLGAAGMVAAGFKGAPYALLAWVGVRLLFFSLFLPLVAFDQLRLKVFRSRRDPYCIHCGYTLLGVPEEGVCPECGRAYRERVNRLFRRDPQWVIAYWRLTGHPPSAEVFEQGHGRGQC